MGMTLTQTLWLLPVALPIGLYVAWSDLSSMKIPNKAVAALVISFGILGLFPLGAEEWAWRWSHLLIVLAIGILMNALGLLGAGDAKFAAAAAPFVARDDIAFVLYLFAGCLLAGFVTHRLARASALRRLVPDWQSWTTGNRFPMGFPLAATLILYLLSPLYRG